jgi:hypothetical protein
MLRRPLCLLSRFRTALVVLTFVTLAFGPGAKADTLTVQGTVTGITHGFNGGFPPVPGDTSDTLSVSLPNLTSVNLGSYTALDIQLVAPTGEQFVVLQDSLFSFNTNYTTGSNYGTELMTDVSVITNTGATLPLYPGDPGCYFSGTNLPAVHISGNATASAGESFTSLDIGCSVPAGLNTDVKNLNAANLEFDFNATSSTDLGPLVALQPIPAATPEPGTLGMLGTALLAGAGLARRRLRR